MSTLPPLSEIADTGTLPNPYDDAHLLAKHQAAAAHLPALYLSLGETWDATAPGLHAHLAHTPLHAHGYALTPYGLPALRRVLRQTLPAEHRIPEHVELGADYDVAATHGSTRSAMFHFGRLLLEDAGTGAGRPALVCTTPGWDYPGVYKPLGYTVHRIPLSPNHGWHPDPDEAVAALRRARAATTGPVLLALNAQHNPTGANWHPTVLRTLVREAIHARASLLIDDAYFAVHDPDTEPTSALAILSTELSDLPRHHRPRWLATRSLGKQNGCNGWGIGAAVAAPDTLTALYGRLLPQHTYASALPLQAAMAAWLDDPASQTYLAQRRQEIAARRTRVADGLTTVLGYPRTRTPLTHTTTYLLAPVPPWHNPDHTGEDWRTHVLRRAGVLLGEAHMTTPGQELSPTGGWVRIHLGQPGPVLAAALDRMAAAGLGWSAPTHEAAAAVSAHPKP
jgi:aspartate/methionine/tyrosine aminotransferase